MRQATIEPKAITQGATFRIVSWFKTSLIRRSRMSIALLPRATGGPKVYSGHALFNVVLLPRWLRGGRPLDQISTPSRTWKPYDKRPLASVSLTNWPVESLAGHVHCSP